LKSVLNSWKLGFPPNFTGCLSDNPIPALQSIANILKGKPIASNALNTLAKRKKRMIKIIIIILELVMNSLVFVIKKVSNIRILSFIPPP